MSALARVVVLAVLLVSVTGAATGQERQLLATESAAIVPVTTETTLRLTGISGALFVEAGKPGELRFGTRPAERSAPAPEVSVWGEDAVLTLSAPAGQETVPRHVEIRVPPGMQLDAHVADSTLTVSGLASGFEVAGQRVDVKALSVEGPIALQLSGGTVELRHLGDDLDLRGSAMKVVLERVAGATFVDVESTDLHATGIAGTLEGRLQGGTSVVKGVGGAVRLRGTGGSLELEEAKTGGELELAGTTLKLVRCGGEFDVRTDAAVQFTAHDGALHVDGYGASVSGEGATGIVEVKTEQARVALSAIEGALRVQGDGLEVSVAAPQSEVVVYATSSTVEVEDARGPVTIENEFGDVRVRGAAEEVKVKNRNGSVHLLELSGPAQVEADGPEVVASWTALRGSTDSLVRNDGGDVWMRVPEGGAFRVEAEAEFGRVVSEVPWVVVNDTGTSAVGSPGRVRTPVLRGESQGDLTVAFRVPQAGS